MRGGILTQKINVFFTQFMTIFVQMRLSALLCSYSFPLSNIIYIRWKSVKYFYLIHLICCESQNVIHTFSSQKNHDDNDKNTICVKYFFQLQFLSKEFPNDFTIFFILTTSMISFYSMSQNQHGHNLPQ